jgi:thiosulfate/3-mercaptopyruvate sulfurtransferase
MSDPVISPEQLKSLPAVLLDCRTGPDARERYAAGHLRYALFADLETELSAKGDPAQGGRHPLPEPSTFAAQLGKWGITRDTLVVAYDDQGGANAAARLWWMLRALGHENVRVLDGGLKAAEEAGFAVTSEPSVAQKAPPYPTDSYQLPTVDIDQVERARLRSDSCVLDVRAAARYRGEQEPIDPVAGHIPGAINIPLTENTGDDGRFKSAEALRTRYAPLFEDLEPKNVIVHCGSGVTACHTLLAMERAGLSGASLYVGSWGEWCRQDRPRSP